MIARIPALLTSPAAVAVTLAVAAASVATGCVTYHFAGPWCAAGLTWTLLSSIAAGLFAWRLRRSVAEQFALKRQIERLCQSDAPDRAELEALGAWPGLTSNSAWNPVLDAVAAALAKPRHRVRELEQSRAALEVRARRNEAQAERIGSILAGLPEPVLAVDNFGDVVLANDSAGKLFDLDAESTEKRALAQLVHCETLVDLLTETRKRTVASQRTAEIEVTNGQGRSQWYSVTARSFIDGRDAESSATNQGAVAVLRDISQQKAIQKRNAEFVSSVSHEMKTPLAGIKAYVELLADGDAEDEATQEEFLSVINCQADRLQRLIDNLLNLARIEAGVVSVNKQSRPLNELLEESFRVMQPAAERKQIELQCFLSPMYLGVLADRDMLTQAAINLLSNAIKYTPAGGQVTLRSRLEDREIRFEVQDTGVGLSPEDCERVFEKFYRVAKDKDMAAGTGLGLPLAKHIVEDVHGGKLTVQSTPGQGSIFTVTLPRAGK